MLLWQLGHVDDDMAQVVSVPPHNLGAGLREWRAAGRTFIRPSPTAAACRRPAALAVEHVTTGESHLARRRLAEDARPRHLRHRPTRHRGRLVRGRCLESRRPGTLRVGRLLLVLVLVVRVVRGQLVLVLVHL